MKLEEVSDTVLHCRELGHAWTWSNDFLHSGSSYSRTVVCSNCKTEREDVFKVKANGIQLVELVRRKYRYPEGYIIEEGTTRQACRDLVFMRLVGVPKNRLRLRRNSA